MLSPCLQPKITAMPHVLRQADGAVLSLHRDPQPGSELLPADHPAVLDFLARDDAGFARLDAGLVRVLEDLIDVLIARQVIRISDLPAEAQSKLFARKSFRERRSGQALRLFGDDADDGVVPTELGGL